jgi:glutathione peroxidase
MTPMKHERDRLNVSASHRRRTVLSACLVVWGCGVLAPAQAASTLPPTLPTPRSAPQASAACPELWQHTLPRLQDEAPQSLCQYAGRVVLVVNTASYCGFTGQYQGLEALYARYQRQGLVVLGFPSNDFGRQEPGSAKEIADFCENTFGVKFPMLSKTQVVGRNAHPLFKQLAARTGEAPAWNFHKYLVDRSGQSVKSYPSAVGPEDPKLIRDLEKLLSQKN